MSAGAKPGKYVLDQSITGFDPSGIPYAEADRLLWVQPGKESVLPHA
jgi:hypothetical protein